MFDQLDYVLGRTTETAGADFNYDGRGDVYFWDRPGLIFLMDNINAMKLARDYIFSYTNFH